MKFNHLKVPDHWEHYWSRHPEGYTIMEALISWVSQVDSMVDNVNNWNDYLDNFVATFDKELQQTVTDTLSDWQTSGFLDVVISEALQWQLDDYITTNEAEKLSLTTQLAQTSQVVDESGLDRVAATSKFITTLSSYIGLVNTAYPEDMATRFYILPKGKVTDGVGGALKIFGDDYQNDADYRDLGIYFNANQEGDNGYYGNGVFWINGKVLESGIYQGKNPDIGFSFQDGKVIAGRITAYGASRAMWVFGTDLSTLHGVDLIAEFQKSVGFVKEARLRFEVDKEINQFNDTFTDVNGNMTRSFSGNDHLYIGGTLIHIAEKNKVTHSVSQYNQGNVVFETPEVGPILTSPDGSKFRLKVANDGVLSTIQI